MAKPTGLSDEVRTIFEARKGQSLGHQQVFELMDVTGVDKTKERNGVRDVLTWLVSCGYLVKSGARATAVTATAERACASTRRQRRNFASGASSVAEPTVRATAHSRRHRAWTR